MSPSFKDDAKRRPCPRSAPSTQAPEWRIETLAEAEQRNETRIDQFLAHGASEIARIIARCDGIDGNGCGQPGCAVCARGHRLKAIKQLLNLAASRKAYRYVVTLYLEHHPLGQLQQADPRRIKESLRKRLDRCGLKGAIFAGGIEVAWQARRQRWLVHAHLLMIGVDENGWAQLKKAYSGSEVDDPAVRDPLNDEDRQISYLVKFVTYHRPGKRLGNRPPRAYPLPAMRLAELATWWSRYRLQDFLFSYGRRGKKIVAR
jgi:hypothetical protein